MHLFLHLELIKVLNLNIIFSLSLIPISWHLALTNCKISSSLNIATFLSSSVFIFLLNSFMDEDKGLILGEYVLIKLLVLLPYNKLYL